MSVQLFIEGGSHSRERNAVMRKGFQNLFSKAMFKQQPQLVACGPRNKTYERFQTAHAEKKKDFVAMLIDSEEPLASLEKAWDHLKVHDRWEKPDRASDEQVLFMTTCMETWIVADRAALRKHYGDKLQESALPPLEHLEERPRDKVQEELFHATRHCSNAYAKGTRSFKVLGMLTPSALKSLPSFARMLEILAAKL